MVSKKPSDVFKFNEFYWNIFGLWPGRNANRYYIYFSVPFLFITFFLYNLLLAVNLVYCPKTVKALLQEVMFFFNEMAIIAKVVMLIAMRKKIVETFEMLDSETFSERENSNVMEKVGATHALLRKCFLYGCTAAYLLKVIYPLFAHVMFDHDIVFPISNYSFLGNETAQKYFFLFYFYQNCIYVHMIYNISIDTFLGGLIMMGIGQFKMLNNDIKNMKMDGTTRYQQYNPDAEDEQMANFKAILKRYGLLIKYCSTIQAIMSYTMFFQYSIAAGTICAVVCIGLLTGPWSTAMYVFMLLYLGARTTEIFLPGFLGTQLSHESQQTARAAYECDWIGRSEPFKQTLKLLMLRANKPVILTGMKMYPLSLGTFVSIMKTAYSFFALVRNFQESY